MKKLLDKILKKNYSIIFYNLYYRFTVRIQKMFRNILINLVKKFGYTISPEKNLADYYLREYSSYEEYKKVQIFHNKRKINKVFADKTTLKRVANIILNEFKDEHHIKGICHGSRNGFEQNFLIDLSEKIECIGTDISETAKNYENSVNWDFHDMNENWTGSQNFIYTNSLDQSWQPKVALQTWLSQLKSNGILIIEHTNSHAPTNASKSDPFGVRPTSMPYVLTMWFGSQISIEHSVKKKDNGRKLDAWLFVVRKNIDKVKFY